MQVATSFQHFLNPFPLIYYIYIITKLLTIVAT
nr:MAG TPA: hypothetical protein [Caudoviricetes sp.]